MSNQFSLEQMRDFLSDNVRRINAVHKELEEIQIGFNSAYVEWKADHDAALGRLGEAVIAHMEEVGPVLQERVQERVLEEQHRMRLTVHFAKGSYWWKSYANSTLNWTSGRRDSRTSG
jgi:hypothetical protein